MNRWWGESWPHPNWRAPVCEDDTLRRPVPVGFACGLCGEDIMPEDQGVSIPSLVGGPGNWYAGVAHHHAECHLRSVTGCSAHLRGEPHDHDVPYREDARRVGQWMQEHG